jgi:hypothetical protein
MVSENSVSDDQEFEGKGKTYGALETTKALSVVFPFQLAVFG